MDYEVAFAGELGIDPEEFAEVWNDNEECRRHAIAEIRSSETTSFDPALGDMAIFLKNVGTGITATALYDLIKLALSEQGVRTTTRMKKVERPEESILIVEKEEEA